MRPTHLLEASDESCVGRLEEHHPKVDPCTELPDDLTEVSEEVASTHIDDGGDLREGVPAR